MMKTEKVLVSNSKFFVRFNNELKVTFKMLGVFDKKYKIANVIPIICPIIKPNEPIFRKPKDA